MIENVSARRNQTFSKDNYIDKDVMLGLQCMEPLIMKSNTHLRVQSKEMWKNLYGQSASQAHSQENITILNAWPLNTKVTVML